MEKEYWVVIAHPNWSCYDLLFTHKKPKYYKSTGEWEPASGDEDWHIGPCWILGDTQTDDKYFEPTKVKISTKFIETKK